MSHYIFGPVNSRRFGSSLGIDLSPDDKRCNFDCLYCELVPKEAQEISDASFSHEDVMEELRLALKQHPKIDVITMTANGEPTMYHGFGDLVDAINTVKGESELLILSNSSLLNDLNIQETLMKFDQVKLSLDAVSQDIFMKVDRPHKSIDIEVIKNAMLDFSKKFSGKLIIEILVVKGINDTYEEIKKLNTFIKKLHPFRIDLSTIDRPPAYGVEAVSNESLEKLAALFDEKLPVEIAYRKSKETYQSYYTPEEIILTLDKRPLTQVDVEMLFDTTAKLHLEALVKSEEVVLHKVNDELFYILKKNASKKRQKA